MKKKLASYIWIILGGAMTAAAFGLFVLPQEFVAGGVTGLCPEGIASVIASAGYVAVCWLFLYFLYRKQVFLKI